MWPFKKNIININTDGPPQEGDYKITKCPYSHVDRYYYMATVFFDGEWKYVYGLSIGRLSVRTLREFYPDPHIAEQRACEALAYAKVQKELAKRQPVVVKSGRCTCV